MATKKQAKTDEPKQTDQAQTVGLTSDWETAWEALEPIRSTWDEKEQALMAQTNDSVSGNITATRVSDAALSTLAYERQARVSAQLPTGRVYAMSKADDKKAALLNIILNRYILPNADSQFDMLIKLRLWGLYASVYGSMPMFYDYRADKRYRGPECYLVNPRCFAPVNGLHNVQEAGCYISTVMHLTELKEIAAREKTSYDKDMVNDLIKRLETGELNKPSTDDNNNKRNTTVGSRYDLSNAKDRVEVVTKYTHDTWTTFVPDAAGVDKDGKIIEDFVIREMDNPHKSGRIPVVMRHCFPLMDSIFGLGDFERGMKVQKAKDSIINLFLEGAKNRVFPPLKMIDNLLTPSTIRYQAGSKWKVKQQDAVQAMTFGNAPLGEFQATYSALQGMLQNMFGTSTTEISDKEGGPAMGKTPQALKMQSARENARDTWDRFMHEKATEELLEGMLNLLTVKMEKPINFTLFEDDIKALGFSEEVKEQKTPDGKVIQEAQKASPVEGLEAFEGAKAGKMTVSKKDISSDTGYSYLIDANSSMQQDDEEQFQAHMATWALVHKTPNLVENLAMAGMEYDEAEHLKLIFISAGITDWERVLKEMGPEQMAKMKQAMLQQQRQMQAAAAQGQPPMDPGAQMAAAMQGGGMPQGNVGMPPQAAPVQVGAQAVGVPMAAPQGPPVGPQLTPQMPAFEDPQIAQVASTLLGGR